MLAIFILLQLADVWTTHEVLKRGGVEDQPFMRRLMELFGDAKTAMVIGKLLMLAGLWYAIVTDQMPDSWLAGFCALYAVVVWSNYEIMRGRASLIERLRARLR